MKIYRWSIVSMLVVLLAACGGQPAAEVPAATAPAPTTAPAVEPTVVAEPTVAEPTLEPAVTAAATVEAESTETMTEATATEVTTVATVAATSEAANTAAAASETAAPLADGTFPVTIQHKYGSTTIDVAPQRVISLGYTDQDPMLALGVVPIAVRYWFGEQPGAVWPWAQDKLGGVTPEILNMPYGELNFEAIAALNPDLIIGVSSGITDAEYATLSQIAPTLAQSSEFVDFGVTWETQTRVIGEALGKATLADTLVKETEALFAEVRAAHPEFAGKTATVDSPAGDGQFFFSGPEHERMRVLTTLGFTLPDELVTLAGDAFYGTVSGEQLPLLDTDIMLWTITADQRVELEKNAVYQQLNAVKQGRVIFLDTTGNGLLGGPALVFSSVLSLPVVFDDLVPQLSAAVDGDPATTATTTSAATTATPE